MFIQKKSLIIVTPICLLERPITKSIELKSCSKTLTMKANTFCNMGQLCFQRQLSFATLIYFRQQMWQWFLLTKKSWVMFRKELKLNKIFLHNCRLNYVKFVKILKKHFSYFFYQYSNCLANANFEFLHFVKLNLTFVRQFQIASVIALLYFVQQRLRNLVLCK